MRQTARQFVDESAIPLMRDAFNTATFPKQLIPQMAELGFFGANLDGYGCAGLNSIEYGLIMQELERADSGLRSFVSVQGALVMYPHFRVRIRRTAPALASAVAIGQIHWLLRVNGTGFRFKSGRHAHHSSQARR